MTLTLTILGCGSSAGVPRPALGWGACDPSNPKNRRRRCSLLAERTGDNGVTRIVIDTSPDLREQLIDADDDCGRILQDEAAKGPFRAVLHCYTGGRELAMKAISLGLSISFTGILTFKKSQALRDLAAELPADRIMVETDAPYLAPGKFRGKRNEPSYVVEIAKVLAEARGVSLEEISRQTTENFFRLFSKVPSVKAMA